MCCSSYVGAVLGYVVRRLGQSLIILAGLPLLTFWLLHLLPGGPERAILGPRASNAQRQAFVHANGLDRPILSQYLTYLNHLLHGNLGYSYKLNQTVNDVLKTD